MDRVRNEEVRRRAGIEMELACRADQRVLRWFGHVERMCLCVFVCARVSVLMHTERSTCSVGDDVSEDSQREIVYRRAEIFM